MPLQRIRKQKLSRRQKPLIESLEPRQLLAADLGVAITTPPSSLDLRAGDTFDLNSLGVLASFAGNTQDDLVSVHLSKDQIFGNSDDFELGVTGVNAHNATVRASFPLPATIPDFLPPGDYYIGAAIDEFNLVKETNETNNFAFTDQPVVHIESTVVNDPGTIDTSFGDAGTMTLNLPNLQLIVADSAVQPDGKLVLVGKATEGATGAISDGQFDFATVRLNADGSLDSTFGHGGIVITTFPDISEAKAVAIAPGGKIVVGGETDFFGKDFNYNGDFALARLNPNGTLDRTFGKNGLVYTNLNTDKVRADDPFDVINDLAVLSDGSIIAVGKSSEGADGSIGYFAAAKYLSNGKLDTTFAIGGTTRIRVSPDDSILDGAFALTLSNSNIYIAGASEGNDFSTDTTVIRLTRAGKLDKTFGVAGKAIISIGQTTGVMNSGDDLPSEHPTSIAIDAAGRLVVGSTIERGSLGGETSTAFGVARFLANGKRDMSFGTRGAASIIVPGLPFAFLDRIVPEASGAILLVGRAAATASDVNNAGTIPIAARLLANGQLDTSFSSTGILRLFQTAPGAPPTLSASPAASTSDAFQSFLASSVVIVAITQGGGIAILAATNTDAGTDLTIVLLDGNDPAVPQAAGTPDLTAKATGKIPASVNPSVKPQITLSISNTGLATAKGKVPLLLVLSTDAKLNDGDLPFSSMPITLNLPSDDSSASTIHITFPSLQNKQKFYLFAVINGGPNSLPEDNRNNNVTKPLGPFTLLPSVAHGGK